MKQNFKFFVEHNSYRAWRENQPNKCQQIDELLLVELSRTAYWVLLGFKDVESFHEYIFHLTTLLMMKDKNQTMMIVLQNLLT